MLEYTVEEKKVDSDMKLAKKDWILILVIVCVAGAAFLMHHFIGGKGASCVNIKVDGKITGTYSLSEDKEIKINNGSNILRIKNGKASMTEADCPDQLCVHQKAVSLNNESIICLPNKVVAEVQSSEASELDAVTN